jgi:glycosyltransferase involved in cell wall biosynthesis
MAVPAARDRSPPAAPALQRVVLNGRFLAQRATGVQRYARETVRALDHLLAEEPLLRRHFDFELAVPRHAASLALDHIRRSELPSAPGHVWEQAVLAWYAGSSYLVNFGYSGPIAKRRQLITLHDASVRAVPQAYRLSYRWLHDALIALLRRRVDAVMTVSRFSRDEIARHYHVTKVLLGVEGWQHCAGGGDGAATLQKFGLQPRRYLLAVGSVKPHKNFEVIERSLALLDAFPLAVAVAGAADIGIFRSGGQALHNVRLLGFVSDAQLADLYRHAAWFVFPSTYEGFGLPALEAMAHGCPVLAARAAAIPEVCGDAALYFPPHDPAALASLLRRVLREPRLRDALAARAQARLRLYSWRANARVLATHLLAAQTAGATMESCRGAC